MNRCVVRETAVVQGEVDRLVAPRAERLPDVLEDQLRLSWDGKFVFFETKSITQFVYFATNQILTQPQSLVNRDRTGCPGNCGKRLL